MWCITHQHTLLRWANLHVPKSPEPRILCLLFSLILLHATAYYSSIITIAFAYITLLLLLATYFSIKRSMIVPQHKLNNQKDEIRNVSSLFLRLCFPLSSLLSFRVCMYDEWHTGTHTRTKMTIPTTQWWWWWGEKRINLHFYIHVRMYACQYLTFFLFAPSCTKILSRS